MTIPTPIARSHVAIPVEFSYQSERHFDETTLSWRMTMTATPTKYASVPVEAVRAAILAEQEQS